VINITNSGAIGAGLGFGTSAAVTGAICANVYVYDPSEEVVACCSCPVTPNGLVSLSAQKDLIVNPLTRGNPTACPTGHTPPSKARALKAGIVLLAHILLVTTPARCYSEPDAGNFKNGNGVTGSGVRFEAAVIAVIAGGASDRRRRMRDTG
jgi:hypothetical protein